MLENVYGQAAGKIIADNCNSKIVLAGLDFKTVNIESPQKAEKSNSFNGRNNNQRNNNQGDFRQNNYSNQSSQNSQSNQSNQSKAVKEYRPQSFNQYKK